MQGPNLFRQEALQHQFTSPEDLERPFKLLRVGAWLPLFGLTIILGTALVWSFVGRVPETVEGTGVLLDPGRVRTVDTSAAGQVKEVVIALGQPVTKGDLIAKVRLPEMEKQKELADLRLAELKRTDATQYQLEEERTRREKAANDQQVKALGDSIDRLTSAIDAQEKRSDLAVVEQRRTLEKNLEDTRQLNQALVEKYESAQRLAASRVITGEQLTQAQSLLNDNKAAISGIEVRLSDLALRAATTHTELVQQRGRVAELEVQRLQVAARVKQLEQETAFNRATRRLQIEEQADRVRSLEASLDEQGNVRSPYTGRVVEVGVLPGQVVNSGTTLATIDLSTAATADDPTVGIKNIAYLPVRVGKRVRVGMQVRVAPTTIQRERYGSIIGTVTRVSAFPVTSRSPTAVVGNAELARAFMSPGGVIEVEVELERGPLPTGFKWTSAGPDRALTAGTTTRTTVTVEERAPITFLLPVLRGWLDSSTPPEMNTAE